MLLGEGVGFVLGAGVAGDELGVGHVRDGAGVEVGDHAEADDADVVGHGRVNSEL